MIILKYLPETQYEKLQRSFSLLGIVKYYSNILCNRVFFGYLMYTSLMVAGKSAFNTNAIFLMIKTYKISPKAFGVMMSSFLVAHLLGACHLWSLCGQERHFKANWSWRANLALAAVFLSVISILKFDGPYFTITTTAVGVTIS